ncbi:MAG TPA: ArgE/DapE family deacylase, partial [Terriglobia bacterium]|nr:ArgE/DapE family deacylase [Terriglobia bacterium]
LPLGDRPVVVAKWSGTDSDARSLILNGHMDVVPTGDDRAWTSGPWSGDVRDNRLWGRGSCDMKGGLAAGVTAVAALQKLGLKPRGDVLIESVIGEETGGVGTLATLLRGYRADAAVILEPTRMALCPTGAGALSFRIRVHGRAAHAAMRQEGVSAVAKFYDLMKAIEELEQQRHRDFHHPLYQHGELAAPISIGKIEAGDWPSTVPETLVAEGRFGVLPGENVTAARAQFEAAVKGASERDEWLAGHPPEIEWFEGQFEPGETRSDSPVIHQLLQAHHEVNGNEPRIHGVSYGSDLRLFTNHGGMNAVLYGPGDVRIAHSLNEFVPLDEVRCVTKVLARSILDWCGWN